ncbi:uncharacterized protein LOC128337236 [Hemicordylus capensis]|uniref:uncharacterized protein LOC128337236 n=1 Tax=Hemicordylus capensis TaxID=884348 RepID=UPI002303505D|nr:uncharacterized protein LOC128337236 [Hemicordylus capensis]
MGGCWACFRSQQEDVVKSQQEDVVKLPEDQEKEQTVVEPQETPSTTSSSTSSSTSKEEVIVAEFFNDLQDQATEKQTAPTDLSQPSPVEPPEDTVSTVLDACPGPSTSRGALQEDLPQGPDAEASSLQPPRPIFAWSSSSASTEYLRLSATCSFSPSCLSLNPSASPPQGFHNVQGKLENLMALQNKQVEDRQEDLMVFRAHLQHVAVMNRQLQQLSMRLGQLEEIGLKSARSDSIGRKVDPDKADSFRSGSWIPLPALDVNKDDSPPHDRDFGPTQLRVGNAE